MNNYIKPLPPRRIELPPRRRDETTNNCVPPLPPRRNDNARNNTVPPLSPRRNNDTRNNQTKPLPPRRIELPPRKTGNARDNTVLPSLQRSANDKNTRASIKTQVNSNKWSDNLGNRYTLKDNNILKINVKQVLEDDIVDYINNLSSDIIKVIIEFSGGNETMHLNMCMNLFSGKSVNKPVEFDIFFHRLTKDEAIYYAVLPNNVKINSTEDNNLYCSSDVYPYFDWWALWLSDYEFNLLLTKVTDLTKKRLQEFRKICKNFYYSFPSGYLDNLSDLEKANLAYDWVTQNIVYDFTSTNPDGTLKANCHDCQDPIYTYNNKKGVCAGQARLMKVLLNNYLIQVDFLTVCGLSGRLAHEWGEVYSNGERYYYDTTLRKKCVTDVPYGNIRHDEISIGEIQNRNRHITRTRESRNQQ